jgi:O-antigen biosynthesis protein
MPKSLIPLTFVNNHISQKSPLRRFARGLVLRTPIVFRSYLHQILFSGQSSRSFETQTSPVKVPRFIESMNYSMDIGFGVPYSENPRASIIIPVHNNWWTTFGLLQSLRSNRESTPYETIIVDDASTDMTPTALKTIRGVRVVTASKNIGYLRATNLGASYANAEYLVLLNNDTEPIQGWLDSILKYMDTDPSIGLAGSNLISADGRLQESGGQIFSDASGWNIGRNESPFQPAFMFNKEVDYCSAAAIVIRTALWKEIGGFDERFVPAYYEDTDLAFEVRSKGYRVVNIPESMVVHMEGVSHGKDESTGIKSFQVKNQKAFFDKWSSELMTHWENKGIPRIEYSRSSLGIVVLVDRQFPAENRDSGSIRTLRLARQIQLLGFHVIVFGDDVSTTNLDHIKVRESGIETHNSFQSLAQSLEYRRDRVKFVWLIRQEIVGKYDSLFSELTPNATKVFDLLDLEYSETTRGIRISPSHEKMISSGNKIVLVSPFEKSLAQMVFPSMDIFDLWKPFEVQELKDNREERKRAGCIFVGGFRHAPNYEGIKWFGEKVIPLLKERGFSQTVKVVGSGLDPKQSKYLQSLGLEILGGCSTLGLAALYESTLCALVPLLSGRGLKGKFAEAAAFGIPVVTTDIGAEGFDVEGVLGVARANSQEEFANQILKIVKSEEPDWAKKAASMEDFCRDNLGVSAFQFKLKKVLGLN